jgi:hypothetical protein
MATVALVPADRQYIVGAASSFTVYATYLLAQAAAITASAGAASAPYYVARVDGQATAPTRYDLVPGVPGPAVWIVQAKSVTTYLPKSAAIAQAYTVSAANSNEPVYVAKAFQVVTGP